jgi:hypothetical protein
MLGLLSECIRVLLLVADPKYIQRFDVDIQNQITESYYTDDTTGNALHHPPQRA